MWVNKILEQVKRPLEYIYTDDFIYRQISKKRKHAWIVAAPKSGSTWLNVMLKDALGWFNAGLTPAISHREPEPEPRRLMSVSRTGNLISPHTHSKYSVPTRDFIIRANVKVILQIRDIFDSVISFRDHANQNNGAVFSMALIEDKRWKILTDADKLAFIIELVVPWYINFYCSWITSELFDTDHVYLCQYESLKDDPLAELTDIMTYLGETPGESRLREVIDSSNAKFTRKNKAIVGRGNDELSSDQKKKIISYTRFYPDIDFSGIGITAEDRKKVLTA